MHLFLDDEPNLPSINEKESLQVDMSQDNRLREEYIDYEKYVCFKIIMVMWETY